MADMPREKAQWKMGLIDEALGKIEAQIKDNAKFLNVESHLGKLFDQEIVIPPSVQRTGVSSDPDIVGQDAPA
ncbi:hypothetical protein [Candidatus Protochlamydia naegleriophila]|uniref:hypothetical protein n=1 Tax=Candidatus Protochlamydia naegleriophila TaxID=389348 RepID=UPI00138F3CD8|nr:hypothetical protein [Candidatus Protochlamydia naegleriophila]